MVNWQYQVMQTTQLFTMHGRQIVMKNPCRQVNIAQSQLIRNTMYCVFSRLIAVFKTLTNLRKFLCGWVSNFCCFVGPESKHESIRNSPGVNAPYYFNTRVFSNCSRNIVFQKNHAVECCGYCHHDTSPFLAVALTYHNKLIDIFAACSSGLPLLTPLPS